MFMMFIYAIHAYLTKTFHIIKHIESIGNENKKSSLFIRCTYLLNGTELELNVDLFKLHFYCIALVMWNKNLFSYA